ncbi:hypothetical protein OSB04_000038 [Centaurea solstitialis]|uniref:Uncharacterized protein n=1 Tax=Centaurea solstitialis TaxID=347529 RepID=A0AA38U6K8_9ASTR|nr:hypothetical protein OSB04_000038 [Centaurea solstitialis]
MGICISQPSTAASATAKLILPDGTLQEFPSAVAVSAVLRHHPSTFICNADDMDFDDVVSPLKPHHLLHPGHLYFALPLTRLNHPLHPEDMAALAVKASAALAKCGGSSRRTRRTGPKNTSFSAEKGCCLRGSSRVADAETVGSVRRSYGGGVGGGKGKVFKGVLSSIPE